MYSIRSVLSRELEQLRLQLNDVEVVEVDCWPQDTVTRYGYNVSNVARLFREIARKSS